LISSSNGTAAYTYAQFDLRGMNGGNDNLGFKGNFTFGDSTHKVGGQGDVAGYGTSVGATQGSLNTGVGPSYFEGLVGNAIINSPGWKLHGTPQLAASDALVMKIHFDAVDTSASEMLSGGSSAPLTVDIVTFGQSEDGVNSSDRHHNGIYRLEAEESGNNNSNIFAAEVEYIMLNQINVNDTATYNGTVAYSDEIVMIVHNDSTDEDEIRVSYLDLGADAVKHLCV
jgi:hypothetical protein